MSDSHDCPGCRKREAERRRLAREAGEELGCWRCGGQWQSVVWMPVDAEGKMPIPLCKEHNIAFLPPNELAEAAHQLNAEVLEWWESLS